MIEDDAAALGADAVCCRFEQPNNTQPEKTVADRGFLFANAFGEMPHDRLQRLGVLNLGAEDVAAAVVHHQSAPLLGGRRV